MKVLQNKLLILVISSILLPTLVVMVISFSNYGRILENNSGQIMRLMCSEKTQVIDEKLRTNFQFSLFFIYEFLGKELLICRKHDNIYLITK